MRRNIFYRKIPAALAAFVLALALCCQTAAAGRALVPGSRRCPRARRHRWAFAGAGGAAFRAVDRRAGRVERRRIGFAGADRAGSGIGHVLWASVEFQRA